MNFIKKYFQNSKETKLKREKELEDLIKSTNIYYKLTVSDKDGNVVVSSIRKGWFAKYIPEISQTGEDIFTRMIIDKDPIPIGKGEYYILNGSDSIKITKCEDE